ncbi:Putative 26S proteasome regulatory subunit-like-like protein [Cladobotryum mycophilum]|uniref:26S proteasome regulatory subunit-like-like protein n=1 Tax=Cladobotryum mycophilum TaxID=491253 RepID=A0ABR0SWM2_9HYPO
MARRKKTKAPVDGASTCLDPVPEDPPDVKSCKGFIDIVEYHPERWDSCKVEIIPTEEFETMQVKSQKEIPTYEDYAIVLRRTWHKEAQGPVMSKTELEIQSEVLCNALRKVIPDSYMGTALEAYPIKLPSPFMVLFFYREEIEALAKDTKQDKRLQRDAQVLYEFIKNDRLVVSIFQDHAKYSKQGRVLLDILWTIYRPNSLAILNSGPIQECWILHRASMENHQGFDGESPRLVLQTIKIPFVRTQVWKITDLPLIPITHCDNWDIIKGTFVKRSMRLRELLEIDMSSFGSRNYNGTVWKEDQSEFEAGRDPLFGTQQINERVIVDYQTAAKKTYHNKKLECFHVESQLTEQQMMARGFYSKSGGSVEPCTEDEDGDNDEDKWRYRKGKPPPDENRKSVVSFKPDLQDLAQLSETVSNTFHISTADADLLCPALVPAFCLRMKKWRWLLIDQLQRVKWDSAAFEFLRLESVTKKLVQSLVKGHQAASFRFDDVITGKGQGLVFLLHGQPGLGKTLTAESVADYLERPLYSITGAELGTSVSDVESGLDDIFDLTKRWNAVTLLDEADVLLCKRKSAEMDRNAVVAVFLRKLEYFQGVLFLTTNRKQDFDDAFKSRIHVTISYPALSEDSQSAIWENLVNGNMVEVDSTWTPEVYAVLAKLKLNGRAIKNILRTSVAFAHAEGEPLGVQHVLTLLETELADDCQPIAYETALHKSEKKRQVESTIEELRGLVSGKLRLN